MRLEVSDLACARAGRRVFAGATFSVAAGALAELVGPNGSGKSSLLRALAGLVAAPRGAARIAARDDVVFALGEDREGYLEQVMYAGHLDAVKPSLGVGDNLAFWARFFGADRAEAAARARAALARFGLAEIADGSASLCSAGQKRRLGLARLAVVDRPVWLLDEPTVSLDAASVETLGAVIAEHLAGGGAVVMATHAPPPVPAALRIDMTAFAPGRGAAADPALDDGEFAW